MKDAQKPDHKSLISVIRALKDGQYVIPDFQREFVWEPQDVQDLVRSIFCDYFIGSLLLWKGKEDNFKALSCESIYGYVGKDKNRNQIVLDGQQRLTAMYYAFFAPDNLMPGRKNRYVYYMHVDRFIDADYDTAFASDWKKAGIDLCSKENREKQFEKHIFPFSVLGEDDTWALANWVQDYTEFWKKKQEGSESTDYSDECAKYVSNAKKFGDHLRTLTDQYQISYVELDQELEIEKICDIFSKVNSKGRQLSVFDLINAMIKPKGVTLKELWRDAKPRLEFVETEKMNVNVLQVMSMLCQSYCSPKYLYYLLPAHKKTVRDSNGEFHTEVLIEDSTDFEKRWNAAVEGLEKSIELLSHPHEFGVMSSKYLPYASILPVFAALQMETQRLSDIRQLDAKQKIAKWYWASVFLKRYSGSTDSTAFRDYLNMKLWFENDNSEPELIQELKRYISAIDLKKEIRGGTAIYNGVFNLLIREGACDWFDGNALQSNNIDDHHIVPKSLRKSMDLDDSIDSILNRAPLTSKTNRKIINDRLPNQYLPELVDQYGIEKVRSMFEKHLISAKALDILLRPNFGKEDFEQFLDARQETIREAMVSLVE